MAADNNSHEPARPTRRSFLKGLSAVGLVSFARLSGAPHVASAARALGKPKVPQVSLNCTRIDNCAICACAGDRYHCVCSDGSLNFNACYNGHNCASSFTLPVC